MTAKKEILSWENVKLIIEIIASGFIIIVAVFMTNSFSNFDENIKKLDKIVLEINSVQKDIKTHDDKIQRLEKNDEKQQELIHEIELRQYSLGSNIESKRFKRLVYYDDKK